MYKLLIAEGEATERKLLRQTLREHLGELCLFFEAKDGVEAMEIAEREALQIAILNIGLPGISGLEVARRIRKLHRHCVLLFLTEFDNFAYAKQAFAVHALDYLLKPYDEKELILAVEEAMQIAERWNTIRVDAPAAEPEMTGEKDTEDARISIVREEIKAFVEAHYMEELSMRDAARAMKYSDAYFCKLFKQCFHVNFSTYLNEYRVEKAKAMMEHGRINVKDISVACGFSDANYFARVFKRITGQTPSEYRLAARRNMEELP